MRTIITLILLFVLNLSVSAKHIPDTLVNYLKEKYPNAEQIHWTKVRMKYEKPVFIVKFKDDIIDRQILLKSNGSVLVVYETILRYQLPRNIQETVKHYKLIEVIKRTSYIGGGNRVLYNIKGVNNHEEVYYVFDFNGHILNEKFKYMIFKKPKIDRKMRFDPINGMKYRSLYY